MAGELWDFAVEVYGRPGVAQLCLKLQDTYGAKVNLLLFAHWLDVKSVLLTPERLHAAQALIADWDSAYIEVLRRLRRQMKNQFTDRLTEVSEVRDHIKAAELAAEKLELNWLAQLAQPWAATSVDTQNRASQNLAVYLASLKLADEDISRLEHEFARLVGTDIKRS